MAARTVTGGYMYGWGDQDIGWHSLFTPAAFWILVCIAICVIVFNVLANKVVRWIDKYNTIEEQEKRSFHAAQRRTSRETGETD